MFKAVKNRKRSWSPAGQIDWPKSVFLHDKVTLLRRGWQLWMKSTGIKQRYQINFSIMFRLSVLLLNSISKLIHNRCTGKLIIKTLRIGVCKRTIACLFWSFNPLFSIAQFWNYTKTIVPLRLSEYCRIILSTSSRGLLDNIHFRLLRIIVLYYVLS